MVTNDTDSTVRHVASDHPRRLAKEFWKFSDYGQIVFTARIVREDPPSDWWERGAIRER